jgi:cysteinyl-tRNA synthetase
MGLVIYNTMTRQKEPFVPLHADKIKMYVCGPTVYDLSHVGHARKEVVFDVIVRYFRYRSYRVCYVRNITDVDDKIINKAREEGASWEHVARRYEEQFHKDMNALGIHPPDLEPRATETIPEMLDMIQVLLDKGSAYVAEGNVYFSVSHCKDYGKLSQRRMEEMLAGARVEVDERKHDPLDFALWKASKPGEPWWTSPWGAGRPGWHIECSAMSRKYLGDALDIHGGGIDLIFPHHENEIAQSESATGKAFCRFWIHNGLLSVLHEKMSKSLGNFITIQDALKTYHPEVLRLFFLSNHYRSPVDYSPEALSETKKNIDYFYTTLVRIQEICGGEEADSIEGLSLHGGTQDLLAQVQDLEVHVIQRMDDDFNTAGALGELFKTSSAVNRWIDSGGEASTRQGRALLNDFRERLRHLGAVFGLIQEDPLAWFKKVAGGEVLAGEGVEEAEIEKRIRQREEARKAKDWTCADQIRKELSHLGIILEDTPQGTRWKRK